jgi:hypothetical protein
MSEERSKVLFIAGSGRSGSTLLMNILEQINGFHAIGELHWIWNRSFIQNKLCGCGNPFSECKFWNAVVEKAFGGMNRIDIHEMLHTMRSLRFRHLPFMWVPRIRQNHQTQLSEYVDKVEKVYRAIQTITGSRVIVDSSKLPTFGYVLNLIPNIDVYVVHLVRDPRAVAYSWTRKKPFEPDTSDPEYMLQPHPTFSAVEWTTRNVFTEMYLRQSSENYMLLRYEDFVDHPQRSIEAILNLLGEPSGKLPFITPDTVEINEVNHSVFGNLVRFQTGAVKLRLDGKWKTEMNTFHKIIVTMLTFPLALKYQYPFIFN